MTQIVFAHGWGFDANMWKNLNDKFFENYEVYHLDFGYTRKLNCDLTKIKDGAICIGHSIGVLWLLKNVKNPSVLISISGFSCFYRYVETSIIYRMKKNIEKNTEVQMRKFYQKSGIKEKKTLNFDKELLLKGLSSLVVWDETKTLEKIHCPVFAIASFDDKIVPIEMSLEIWKNYELNIIPKGGHILPLSESKSCLKTIKRILNDIKIQK